MTWHVLGQEVGGRVAKGWNCRVAVVMLVLLCECGGVGLLPVPLVASSVKWEERQIEASFTND